jgi:hypothetical protein
MLPACTISPVIHWVFCKRNPFVLIVFFILNASAQHSLPTIARVEPQPLLSQALRLQEALNFLGSPLPHEDAIRLKNLQRKNLTHDVSQTIQNILDPYCIAFININSQKNLTATVSATKLKLLKSGWRSFLIKIHNEAKLKGLLEVQSPQAEPVLHIASGQARAKKENALTKSDVSNRFLELSIYRNRPLQPTLSGLDLEYVVLQIYSSEGGAREAEITFSINNDHKELVAVSSIKVDFNILPPVRVNLSISDEDGSPAMASFIISDGIEHVLEDSVVYEWNTPHYRSTAAKHEYGYRARELNGIYPLPSRRVASYNEYPDFFFQPQVYRSSGEHVDLPPGTYHITYTRGPEYLSQKTKLIVPDNKDSITAAFKLKRWIDMKKIGWFSADQHIHAAGCMHYESPEEGVSPQHMWRQILGEDLNVGSVLTWGPGWYHQKSFFSGKTNPLSTRSHIMRYDVEVSGFPSSHAGHLILLRLEEDDYPGTSEIEEWPSWTLPVLKWAKSQNAVVGYAHAGSGLEPVEPTEKLPNYVLPKMDGIGANEYVVTVTQNAVDFYGVGDTPIPWELNMWYHSLNCGFRPRIGGETDYPCVFDERVGVARSYFKSDSNVNYDSFVKALKDGRCYVSDGKTHIIDFSVNGVEAGTENSEVLLSSSQKINVKANIAAYLPKDQDEKGAALARKAIGETPYWEIEKARMGKSRKVPVELIVNGESVDTTAIEADGAWKDVSFEYNITRSSWVALRIYPGGHTNPVFVLVGNKPVQIKRSAEWCRKAVDQCWKMKENNIRPEEREAARAHYDKARKVYDDIIAQAAE